MASTLALPIDTAASPRLTQGRALDRLGVAAAFICLIHCLASPVLILLLPVAGEVWSHPAAHWIAAALVVPLALIVIGRGYLKHRRVFALVAAVLGCLLVVAGIVAPGVEVFALPVDFLPSGWFNTPAAATTAAPACSAPCCPSLSHNAEAASTQLSLPLGTVATFAGSICLAAGHLVNLKGCHALSLQQTSPCDDCGCN